MFEHGELGHSSSEARDSSDRPRKQHGDFLESSYNNFD
jgi:hypothetical protein